MAWVRRWAVSGLSQAATADQSLARSGTPTVRTRWLLVIAAVAVVRSLVLATLTPPYQSSDEPWHLDYARSVAEGELPVLGRTELDPAIVVHDRRVSEERDLTLYGIDDPALSREAFQPPLGYLVPAVGYRLADGPEEGLVWFRAVNVALGALIAVLAFGVGRRAFPSWPWAAPTAGLAAACLPSVGLVTATANNDALAVALALAALAVAVGLARVGGPPGAWLVLGVVVGLAALTKSTGLALVVPAALAALVAPGRHGRAGWRVGLVLCTVGLLVLPWAARNQDLYHDALGTAAFAPFDPHPGDVVGWRTLLLDVDSDHLALPPFWAALTRSAVGVLRWSDLFLPWWTYAVAAVAAVVALLAVGRWLLDRRRGARPADRRAALVVAAALAAYVAAVAWFSLRVDYQPQGRYVLPGLLGAAAVVGAALRHRGFGAAVVLLGTLLVVGWGTTLAAFGLP